MVSSAIDRIEIICERIKEEAFVKGCELSVLLENKYDEIFWRSIIESVKPNLRGKIDFPSPSGGEPRDTRGVDILKKFQEYVCQEMIICIDSDCVYLYKNNEPAWYEKKYIFNTIVHSRENFQCDPYIIDEICLDFTGNDYEREQRYSYTKLFEDLSRQIAPLFYLWLYLKGRSNQSPYKELVEEALNNEVFGKLLPFDDENFNHPRQLVTKVTENVERLRKKLKDRMEDEFWYSYSLSVEENEIPQIKAKLEKEHLIFEKNALSFFHGHTLENFTSALLVHHVNRTREAQERVPVKEEDIKKKMNEAVKVLIDRADNKWIQKIQEKLREELPNPKEG
jgi:hypothetical protein